MKTPENAFKTALQRKDPQIGLWLALADSYAAEICAGSGFDWILIDGEHAPNDLRTTLSALQAVASYSSHPVVRLPHGDAALIKQALDIGAETLLIPMVETAEQAAALVRATRYPPDGIRGVGSSIARSSRWSNYPNYLHEANQQVCLLLQIETATGLQNLEAICNVDGVDGIFIGPADLSASLGHIGNSNHPDVLAAIDGAIRRVARTGKAAGILMADEARARQCLALGATFVAVGVDTSLLRRETRNLAARFNNVAELADKSSGPY